MILAQAGQVATAKAAAWLASRTSILPEGTIDPLSAWLRTSEPHALRQLALVADAQVAQPEPEALALDLGERVGPALPVRFLPAPDPLGLEDGHADHDGTWTRDRSSGTSN